MNKIIGEILQFFAFVGSGVVVVTLTVASFAYQIALLVLAWTFWFH